MIRKDIQRRVNPNPSAMHEKTGIILLLAGWLAIVVGCQGEKTVGSQKGRTEVKKSSSTTELARTLTIRQAYVDAQTDEQREVARKALVSDLKKRYAGIDCHAPQDKIWGASVCADSPFSYFWTVS